MSIEELSLVIPPPTKVIDKGKKSVWGKIEKKFSIHFPTDFYDFSTTYGTGDFCGGYIEVYNPRWDRYYEKIKYFISQLEHETVRIPYAFYPKTPGLFPIGDDESHGNIYWYTEGSPDNWPIILTNRDRQTQRWDMSLTTFLAKAFKNEIKTLIWENFDDKEIVFRPKSR